MSHSVARHGSHDERPDWHLIPSHSTERDRIDAARLRPLRRRMRRERLRENAALLAASGVVLAFATYVTTTR